MVNNIYLNNKEVKLILESLKLHEDRKSANALKRKILERERIEKEQREKRKKGKK